MKYSAILGLSPSKGARSPRIWNQLYQQVGINAEMLSFDCKNNDSFLSKLNELANDPNFQGGAIAAPYKEVALKIVKPINEQIANIGAINSIKRDDKGTLWGTNTDAISAIEEIATISELTKSKVITILGFGGTAKSIGIFLQNSIPISSKIIIASRRREEHLIFSNSNVTFCPWDQREEYLIRSDLIINCTSLGDIQHLGQNPIALDTYKKLKKNVISYDVIYQPPMTPFRKLFASETRTKNGCGMNLLQAQLSFQFCNPEFTIEQIKKINIKI